MFGQSFVLTMLVVLTLNVKTLLGEGHAECFPNPCQNGGSCQQSPGKSFQCACNFGFSGDRCEIANRCHFHTVIDGQDNTDDVDVAKLTGLNMTDVEECKNKCLASPGCRAIDAKNKSCNVFNIVPISIPDISPMTSEKGRLYAVRRCFKRKKTPPAAKDPSTPSSLGASSSPEEDPPNRADVSEKEKKKEQEEEGESTKKEEKGTEGAREERVTGAGETRAGSERDEAKKMEL